MGFWTYLMLSPVSAGLLCVLLSSYGSRKQAQDSFLLHWVIKHLVEDVTVISTGRQGKRLESIMGNSKVSTLPLGGKESLAV